MISIIIPTLNEEKVLKKTIESVLIQPNKLEIIISDGGSTDNTLNIAKKYAKIVNSKKGRGIQMNSGTKFANGDILLFLHADTILPKNATKEIKKILKDKTIIAGGFHKKYNSPKYVLSSKFFNSKIWLKIFKFIPGDQAIFIRKNTFTKIKGFKNISLMEDVEIFKRLKTKGKIKLLKKTVITSSRRFEHKPIRTLILMSFLLTSFYLGANPNKLKKKYLDVR